MAAIKRSSRPRLSGGEVRPRGGWSRRNRGARGSECCAGGLAAGRAVVREHGRRLRLRLQLFHVRPVHGDGAGARQFLHAQSACAALHRRSRPATGTLTQGAQRRLSHTAMLRPVNTGCWSLRVHRRAKPVALGERCRKLTSHLKTKRAAKGPPQLTTPRREERDGTERSLARGIEPIRASSFVPGGRFVNLIQMPSLTRPCGCARYVPATSGAAKTPRDISTAKSPR